MQMRALIITINKRSIRRYCVFPSTGTRRCQCQNFTWFIASQSCRRNFEISSMSQLDDCFTLKDFAHARFRMYEACILDSIAQKSFDTCKIHNLFSSMLIDTHSQTRCSNSHTHTRKLSLHIINLNFYKSSILIHLITKLKISQ